MEAGSIKKFWRIFRVILMNTSIYLMFGLYLPIIHVVSEKLIFLFPLGAGILLLGTWNEIMKRIQRRKDCWLLLLFCVSYMGTILLNIDYNLMQNIKSIIWLGIYIVVFYLYEEEDSTDYYKGIIRLNHTIIFICFVANLLSVFMYFGGYYVQYGEMPLGITLGRLYGVYGNHVNSGSMLAVCVVTSAVINRNLIKKYKLSEKLRNWEIFYCVSSVLAYIYIIGSGSRTTRGCIVIGGSVYICGYIYHKIYKKPIVVRIILTLVAAVFGFGMLESMNVLTVKMLQREVPIQSEGLSETEVSENNEEVEAILNLLGRDEENAVASVSIREAIWEQCILLWQDTHPIMGIGNANMKVYALSDETPEKYHLLSNGEIGESAHNSPIAILLFSGISGSVIVSCFLIERFFRIITAFFRNVGKWDKEKNAIYMANICILISLLLFGMMFVVILFNNILETILFWLYLGMMQVCFLQNEEQSDGKCIDEHL